MFATSYLRLIFLPSSAYFTIVMCVLQLNIYKKVNSVIVFYGKISKDVIF